MKKRTIVGVTVALYVTLLMVAWHAGTRQARARTEAMLDYAVNDIRVTMDGAIDMVLEHVAVACVRYLETAHARPLPEVADIAEVFDVDELNVVDRASRIIATNDPDSLGVDMALKDVTRPFLALTNGTTKVVSQPFRRHAYSHSRRKYLGVPFPGGDGYVQVGMDEARVAKMLPSQLAFLFDAQVDDTVCYLCANLETGALVSKQFEGGKTPTLQEIGFDSSVATDPDKTFEQKLFGTMAFCRSFVFGGHRFLVIEPKTEFYGTRDMILAVMTVLLALVLGAFAVLLARISEYAKRIKVFYAAEDAARAKDMEIAKRIQTSALPVPLAANPHFCLSASMTPAREVGGDFYDFFMLDQTHVAFLVADVSGKGITAALYMMTAKTLIKDTLISIHDPAEALDRVNAELCANNPANMFLTAWVGVLDLETGTVTFANAGHNPPIKVKCRKTEGAVEFVSAKSGPVLAFAGGVKYAPRTVHLDPGETLFLYTDGVTEAMDTKGALFGDERLATTLSAVSPSRPDAVCGVVRAAVVAFAAGAPAADDLTVLAVEYISRPDRFVRTFPSTQDGIAQASAFLDKAGKAARVASASLSTLHVILDEIASNIVKHSGASGFEVEMELMDEPPGVMLVFIDDGVPYDPLAHADPDTSLPADERPIGGLGILMVKKMASSVSYRRVRNRNILSVRLSLPHETDPA